MAMLGAALLLPLVSMLGAYAECPESIMHPDTSEERFGIWAHAWGSDPALGPIMLSCAYDWAVEDSRTAPYIRLEFGSPMMIDQLIGGEIASAPETIVGLTRDPIRDHDVLYAYTVPDLQHH